MVSYGFPTVPRHGYYALFLEPGFAAYNALVRTGQREERAFMSFINEDWLHAIDPSPPWKDAEASYMDPLHANCSGGLTLRFQDISIWAGLLLI